MTEPPRREKGPNKKETAGKRERIFRFPEIDDIVLYGNENLSAGLQAAVCDREDCRRATRSNGRSRLWRYLHRLFYTAGRGCGKPGDV